MYCVQRNDEFGEASNSRSKSEALEGVRCSRSDSSRCTGDVRCQQQNIWSNLAEFLLLLLGCRLFLLLALLSLSFLVILISRVFHHRVLGTVLVVGRGRTRIDSGRSIHHRDVELGHLFFSRTGGHHANRWNSFGTLRGWRRIDRQDNGIDFVGIGVAGVVLRLLFLGFL